MEAKQEPERENIFYFFPNHGDDDGNNSLTIVYGDPTDDIDDIIVGAEDTEEDATEACRRLNNIIQPLRATVSRLEAENRELRMERYDLHQLVLELTGENKDTEAMKEFLKFKFTKS